MPAAPVDPSCLPAGLSRIAELDGLQPAQARLLAQLQGRTYARMLDLVESFVLAGALDPRRSAGLADAAATAVRRRGAEDERRHRGVSRELDRLASCGMSPGWRFVPDPRALAARVPATSTWAVLALTLAIALSAQAHYRSSLAPGQDLSAAWKDVFRIRWQEEAPHAVGDEIDWRREHARLSAARREHGVSELIALIGLLDREVRRQARADAHHFAAACCGSAGPLPGAIEELLRGAYRGQHVLGGVHEPRFGRLLQELLTPAQRARLHAALAPIAANAPP